MKKKSICLFFLVPICASIISCSSNNKPSEDSQSSEKPFDISVPVNMEEGVDFIRHEADDNHKWEYDSAMWYVNNLDKVPLPDPQVYEEDGTYYIVGTDDSSSCKYIPCYYTTDFVNYEKKNIYNPASFKDCWENRSNPTMYAPEMYKVGDKYYLYYSAVENSSGHRRNSVVWADNQQDDIMNSDDPLKSPIIFNDTVIDSDEDEK